MNAHLAGADRAAVDEAHDALTGLLVNLGVCDDPEGVSECLRPPLGGVRLSIDYRTLGAPGEGVRIRPRRRRTSQGLSHARTG
jgi:hypothetical protein